MKTIFNMARQQAPCFLVIEDLDSIVTDQIRSYFLNEVDGLQSNDGILLIGSTNHLDRLDPGLSVRSSLVLCTTITDVLRNARRDSTANTSFLTPA